MLSEQTQTSRHEQFYSLRHIPSFPDDNVLLRPALIIHVFIHNVFIYNVFLFTF